MFSSFLGVCIVVINCYHILVVDQYIGQCLDFFNYRRWPLSFSVWLTCLKQDFYFDCIENGGFNEFMPKWHT